MFSSKGFTVIELLVVIALMAILMGIAGPRFYGYQKSQRDAERESDLGALKGLIENFYNQNGVYPTLGQINDGSVPGVKSEMRIAPTSSDSSSSLISSSSPTADKYGYLTYKATQEVCTTGPDCGRKFTLFWYSETSASVKSIRGIH